MSNSTAQLLESPPDIEMAQLSGASAPQSPQQRDKSSKYRFSLITSTKGAFRDAWKDIKSIPRSRFSPPRLFWCQLAISVWILSLLILLFFLSFSMTLNGESPCQQNGDLNIKIKIEQRRLVYTNNWWAPKGFFEVNLAWGKLNFTGAKLADVTWDLVVGRGGQAIMSLIAWKVFNEYLEVSIAILPASYETVWLVRFHQETSVLSSVRLIVQFFRRGLASKAATWTMAMSLSFILAFPTMASSMTGYTAFNNPYITTSDDGLSPLNDLNPVAYIIHDGDRATNLSENFIVPWSSDRSEAEEYGLHWGYCFGFDEKNPDESCQK
ncbi:hypothetical protein FSPOR_4246 [Fusarium sporotrichioides]|uniref:Uncharacterized protein n=1 Tax=Fusarium sporotrichioides TaxID=5514 RepID=A0A395SCJ2_FUSSP|nr:hypothetical protein FSPOR_4246 [Fusarium sporotrichioides]